MQHDALRRHLRSLRDALNQCGETLASLRVADALEQSDAQLEAFLVSNDLWGGAGSIADQAGGSARRFGDRIVEAALIDLGEAQVRAGLTNVRTKSWVEAFRSWRDRGA